MGCCCLSDKKMEQIEQEDSISKQELEAEYRQSGKKSYNSKEYIKAANYYELALKNNHLRRANYTNLALTYKALGKYTESINIINRMLMMNKIQQNSIKFIVKGKIIKARSQTLLSKNYCLVNYTYLAVDNTNLNINNGSSKPSKQQEKAETQNQAIQLINNAILALQQIVQSVYQRNIGVTMDVYKYLSNSKNIWQCLHSSHKLHQIKEQDNQLLLYLEERLKSEDSIKMLPKIEEYFGKTQDVYSYIKQKLTTNMKGNAILEYQENQQCLIDPITYDQYVHPIIVKSGLTYQQSVLKEHLQKNGSTDPITRQKLQGDCLGRFGIRNHTLERYIRECQSTEKKNQQLLQIYD